MTDLWHFFVWIWVRWWRWWIEELLVLRRKACSDWTIILQSWLDWISILSWCLVPFGDRMSSYFILLQLYALTSIIFVVINVKLFLFCFHLIYRRSIIHEFICVFFRDYILATDLISNAFIVSFEFLIFHLYLISITELFNAANWWR